MLYSIDSSEPHSSSSSRGLSSTNSSNMSVNSSETKPVATNTSANHSSSHKVDCAKECPCGVPTIPVPDQWLEVMVTGGFKVWHIIFIIIALVVTLVVVYCCFHRCRIPRTKQEIEADLMRLTIAQKFRDCLQELPNEPTTFMEALKKVQDLEEKLEQDDAEQLSRDLGARKRMGWLKLKGKDKTPTQPATQVANNETTDAEQAAAADGEPLKKGEPPVEQNQHLANNLVVGSEQSSTKLPSGDDHARQDDAKKSSNKNKNGNTEVNATNEQPAADRETSSDRRARKRERRNGNKMLLIKTKNTKRDEAVGDVALDAAPAAALVDQNPEKSSDAKTRGKIKLKTDLQKEEAPGGDNEQEQLTKRHSKQPAERATSREDQLPNSGKLLNATTKPKELEAAEQANVHRTTAAKSNKARKRDKPNLSRTKASAAPAELEQQLVPEHPHSNQLELPASSKKSALNKNHHHHNQQQPAHHVHIMDQPPPNATIAAQPTGTKMPKKREHKQASKHQLPPDHQPD